MDHLGDWFTKVWFFSYYYFKKRTVHFALSFTANNCVTMWTLWLFNRINDFNSWNCHVYTLYMSGLLHVLQTMSQNKVAEEVMTKPHIRKWGNDNVSVYPGSSSSRPQRGGPGWTKTLFSLFYDMWSGHYTYAAFQVGVTLRKQTFLGTFKLTATTYEWKYLWISAFIFFRTWPLHARFL